MPALHSTAHKLQLGHMHASSILQGLALGFVLLRVESLVEEGKI